VPGLGPIVETVIAGDIAPVVHDFTWTINDYFGLTAIMSEI